MPENTSAEIRCFPKETHSSKAIWLAHRTEVLVASDYVPPSRKCPKINLQQSTFRHFGFKEPDYGRGIEAPRFLQQCADHHDVGGFGEAQLVRYFRDAMQSCLWQRKARRQVCAVEEHEPPPGGTCETNFRNDNSFIAIRTSG